MDNYLLLGVLALGVINFVLVLMVLFRRPDGGLVSLAEGLALLEKGQERTERAVREEVSRNRDETSGNSKQMREEMASAMSQLSDSFLKRIMEISQLQKDQLDSFTRQLATLTQGNELKLGEMRQSMERRLTQLNLDANQNAQQGCEQLAKSLGEFAQSFSANQQVLTQTMELKLEQMRQTIEGKLVALQQDTAQKLEVMRATVDEKLHATLEKRLGESFQIVSERLELVHKGLGEMQSLANGVGDLKKVLSNIKTRGNWGEVQLGNLLEQMLTPEQYAANVQVNPSSADRVEYAIRLPGREGGCEVWLPIDAKFPQEDYQRLLEAADRGEADTVAACAAALETRIRGEAKKIREKYICLPHTTDFAIMFLPTEGLFAEVLRRPGLCDGILHEHRVVLTGPTTLAAVLSSLQMGFRTLAIEKRSSEVWDVLGAVKTEFGKFGDVLEKVQKKLDEASKTIDSAATRSRVLERKLKGVEAMPQEEASALLGDMEQLRLAEETAE